MKKNALKRAVSVLFCVAILASFFMVSPAYAQVTVQRQVKLEERFLNPEECWIEAGKYSNTGLSRDRIAVEIYALSLAKYSSETLTKYQTATLAAGGICLVAVGGGWAVAGPAGVAAGGYVCDGALKASTVVNVALGFTAAVTETITLGGDSEALVRTFYALWHAMGMPNFRHRICSALHPQFQSIDISNNSTNNGAKVQLWNLAETDAQLFDILYTGEDDWFNIFKKGTFKCLDVTGGKAEKGVNVQLWQYNGTWAQQWRTEKADDGYVYLINRLGYYMDACGGNSANGTQIWTWTFNGTDAQKWLISD